MRLAVVLALTIALAGAGCRTMTGRSAGQWADDRAVTARVKARLATVGAHTLTRVHVDTYEGIVYLTGGVPSAEMKERAEALVRSVSGVREVVGNLHVPDGVAASPPTERSDSARDPLRARFPGIVRLDAESGTPGWTRYGAYDVAGRRVATVYAFTDGTTGTAGDLPASGLVVDHVSILDGASRYVVLWHVTAERANRLR